jgi:asparagine synthetase B (glutamine-hydrolysing)
LSGLGALLRTDGGAPDDGDAARWAAALAHRGAVRVLRDGPLLLAGTALASLRGRHLAWDGWIDDGEGLRAALGAEAPPADAPDADLALAALLRWGPAEGAARLTGEFAFALGHPAEGFLLLGRDAVGTRPLLSASLPGRCAAATDAAAVLDGTGLAAGPDEEVVAEIVAGRLVARERTVLRGVERILPGTLREASRPGAAARTFREIGAGAAAGPGDPAAALDAFRAALEDALRRRLRGRPSATLLLGGGLDSATLAVLSAPLAREPGIPILRTATVTFPGLPCDEGAAAAALAAHLGLPRVAHPAAAVGFADLRRSAREARLRTDGIPALAFAGAIAAIREEGTALLLDGEGGDEIFLASPLRIADLLAAGRPRDALRAARAWGGSRRGAARVLGEEGLRPLLPDPLRRFARLLRRRPGPPPWLAPGWDAGRGVAARTRVPPPRPLGGSRAAGDRREGLRTAAVLEAFEVLDRRALRAGAAAAHPFLDLRVIEAGLALPSSLVDDGPAAKPALRRILAERIPADLLASRRKADFGPVVDAFLDGADGLPPAPGWALVRRGWVDGDALGRLGTAARAGGGGARAALANLADLEAWAATLDGDGGPGELPPAGPGGTLAP